MWPSAHDAWGCVRRFVIYKLHYVRVWCVCGGGGHTEPVCTVCECSTGMFMQHCIGW